MNKEEVDDRGWIIDGIIIDIVALVMLEFAEEVDDLDEVEYRVNGESLSGRYDESFAGKPV